MEPRIVVLNTRQYAVAGPVVMQPLADAMGHTFGEVRDVPGLGPCGVVGSELGPVAPGYEVATYRVSRDLLASAVLMAACTLAL